jgi:cytochrome b-561
MYGTASAAGDRDAPLTAASESTMGAAHSRPRDNPDALGLLSGNVEEVESLHKMAVPSPTSQYGALATAVLSVAFTMTMLYTLDNMFESLLVWPSFPLHPLLMTISFGLFAPLAVVVWRVGENMMGMSHANAKVAHGMLMFGATLTGFLGLADMWIVHSEGDPPPGHFQSAHSWIGIVTLAGFATNFLGGFVIFAAGPASNSLRRRYKPVHKILGATAAAFALFALVTGIMSLGIRGDNTTPKDLGFKFSALLAIFLLPATALVFT